jgi:hypothetical protein
MNVPRRFLTVMMMMMIISFILLQGSAQENPAHGSTEADKIARNIHVLKLHTVQEGKRRHLIIGPEDLKKGNSIEITGYVTGILILSDREMNVSVDGQDMSKVNRNTDGTYSIKHFGKVDLDSEKHRPARGYSFFPRVRGDSVSAQERFGIELKDDEGSFVFWVKQVPHCTILPPAAHAKFPFELQYLGCRLPDHMKHEDFDRRLDAIGDGIRFVEKTFNMKLVDRVIIIDYEKIRNAVTCEEQNDIWFYIRTFIEEPVEELKKIAQHETLHILVDRMGFTKDPSVRSLFGELKGYDALSRERHELMTRGFTSPTPDAGKVNKFFAFIDERNFLEGMKGGHSSQDLDEFATSFLHSLMYMDRLERNLSRPLKINKQQPAVYLSEKEKTEIRDTYFKAVEVFLKAAEAGRTDGGTHSFLLSCRYEF